MSQALKVSAKICHLTKPGTLRVNGCAQNGTRGVVSIALSNKPTVKMMSSPSFLKDKLGLDTYFAETEGDTVTKVAATKKLLEEEQMRTGQSLKIPLSQIVKKNARSHKFSSERFMKIQMEDL